MSNLYICVFEGAAEVALGDPIQEEVVVFTSSSVQSNAISTANAASRVRRRVRLYPDADCFVTWGENPTVLTDGTEGRPLGAEQREYFDIESGHKIAVIERT